MGDNALSFGSSKEKVMQTASPSAPASARPVTARRKFNLTILLRNWHKRAGLVAFVFMGWLGLSGILINQSPSWGYDTDKVYWSWVMSLYGLEPQPPQKGFASGRKWLAVTPEGTALDAQVLIPPIQTPVGMVASQSEGQTLLFIATPASVAVVTETGERFDDMHPPILPVSAVRRIGSKPDVPGSVVVQDLDAYITRDAGLSWAPVDPTGVVWSGEAALPEAERERLLPLSRPFVTLEHVLVDAHSGAIFGRGGVYVINTIGVMAILLAISGIWMWWRTGRRL